MTPPKTKLEELLEKSADLQRGFAYAASMASGDKAGIYREIKKVVDFAAEILGNQADLDKRLAAMEQAQAKGGMRTLRLPK